MKVKFDLEERGFAVEIAENGRGGLDRARRGKFDLIVLDFHLPKLEAFEIVGCLKLQKVQCPIIVITGSPGPEMAAMLMKAGVADLHRQRGELRRYAACLHLGKAAWKPNIGLFTVQNASFYGPAKALFRPKNPAIARVSPTRPPGIHKSGQ